jgi:hypothetical protein
MSSRPCCSNGRRERSPPSFARTPKMVVSFKDRGAHVIVHALVIDVPPFDTRPCTPGDRLDLDCCAALSPIGPGCVKTRRTILGAQQKKRTCSLSESMLRDRHPARINLALERPQEWFSHSQDPKLTFGAKRFTRSAATISNAPRSTGRSAAAPRSSAARAGRPPASRRRTAAPGAAPARRSIALPESGFVVTFVIGWFLVRRADAA